ncbi:hypothetical protein ACTWPF_09105 [Oceanobacillus sp. M65]|uniref:LysM domain-containing protein n=1 Tax=Oceanobacillus jordanicus TaxID=2867266 RepID=A0AAW5B1V9_9BACI|nr:hypothetical protein [Oceanobacillus jordanicus]MCG3418688.1 hypothetical protein [Oceanobacillus jordanicus]
MSFLKRCTLFLLCVFLIAAVYTDLTKGSLPTTPENNETNTNYTAKQLKVQQGETVLSIIEKINPTLTKVSVDNFIKDFQVLNAEADPFHLQVDRYYYFPVYE